MSTTRRLLPLALATTVQSQAAARGSGGDSPPPSIATVEITPSRLDWTQVLGIGNDPITLTIAGPEGFYFEKRFPRGTAPAFELGEVRDRTPPDGAYSYELRTQGKRGGRVQSGFLSVREGKIFVPATGARGTEPPSSGRKPSGSPLQLKVINASECVGDGCVAGNEGFPLRLKSTDSLRLDFTDLAGAFTSNHSWAIQANDVFIGSGTYLAVKDVDAATTPFTITANAPDNSLFMSSSGSVGLGTATPAVRLDAKVTSSGSAVARLQNLSSSGYSAIEYLDQSGNVDLFFGIDNANSTTRLNSVNNNPIVVLTNSSERMRVTAAGDIGIGTASPNERLEVACNGSNKACFRVTNANATGFSGMEAFDESGVSSLFIGVDNAGNSNRINYLNNNDLRFLANGTERLRFNNSGNVITAVSGAVLTNGGVWQSVSSRESKRDIADLSEGAAFDALQALKPVTFRYKAEPDEQYVGFVAEEVPELVATNDHKHLNAMDIVAVLTKVVQEQQTAIEELRAQVAELKSKP